MKIGVIALAPTSSGPTRATKLSDRSGGVDLAHAIGGAGEAARPENALVEAQDRLLVVGRLRGQRERQVGSWTAPLAVAARASPRRRKRRGRREFRRAAPASPASRPPAARRAGRTAPPGFRGRALRSPVTRKRRDDIDRDMIARRNIGVVEQPVQRRRRLDDRRRLPPPSRAPAPCSQVSPASTPPPGKCQPGDIAVPDQQDRRSRRRARRRARRASSAASAESSDARAASRSVDQGASLARSCLDGRVAISLSPNSGTINPSWFAAAVEAVAAPARRTRHDFHDRASLRPAPEPAPVSGRAGNAVEAIPGLGQLEARTRAAQRHGDARPIGRRPARARARSRRDDRRRRQYRAAPPSSIAPPPG